MYHFETAAASFVSHWAWAVCRLSGSSLKTSAPRSWHTSCLGSDMFLGTTARGYEHNNYPLVTRYWRPLCDDGGERLGRQAPAVHLRADLPPGRPGARAAWHWPASDSPNPASGADRAPQRGGGDHLAVHGRP